MSQRATTADVTVIGLGRMGAALANALLKGGRRVAVWNRDASKTNVLRDAGAHVCATFDEAVRANPYIVVCVTAYDTWIELLNALTPGALDGKTVIQLSNGDGDEARALRDRHASLGASSLDGSILGYPSGVGAPEFPITISGDAKAFAAAAPVLAPLGDLQYVGENIAASSSLESAVVSFTYGSLACYLQSAVLVRAAGVAPEELSKRTTDVLEMVGSLARQSDAAIAAGDHGGSEATLITYLDFLKHVRAFTKRVGASTRLITVLEDITAQAVESGHGNDEISALYEVLRPAGAVSSS